MALVRKNINVKSDSEFKSTKTLKKKIPKKRTTRNTKKNNKQKEKIITQTFPIKQMLAIHCLGLLNDFVEGKVKEENIRDELNKASEAYSSVFNQMRFFKNTGHLDQTVIEAFKAWTTAQATPARYKKIFRGGK